LSPYETAFDTVSKPNENGLVIERDRPNALVMKSCVWLASEHAIADRERIVRREADGLGGGCRHDAIGQMPRPELIGMARVRREPQLVPAMTANAAASGRRISNSTAGFAELMPR
jgi:hypothetical protein